MGYSDQLDILKKSLDGYGSEESKLSNLYKNAISIAEENNKNALKQLDKDYYNDRNVAYADTAQSERNYNNLLASRGLGFSGEAAQAKLNSNVILSTRLSDLSAKRQEAKKAYNLDLANKISQLSMDEADKLRELLDTKIKTNLEIAGMELNREQSEANRKAEKENLATKIDAEKHLNDSKQQAEKDRLQMQIDADKESQQAQINADKEKQQAQINADKESQQAQINADKDTLNTKLQHEKDLQDAELLAKYYNNATNGSTGNNTSNEKGENNKKPEEETSEGYVPDITPKDLAKQITGGKRIEDEKSRYAVDKFIFGLRTNYNINDEYYNQLILMLESYGYSKVTLPELRTRVVTYEAKEYNSDEQYDKYYNLYVTRGYTPYDAKRMAKHSIANNQMNYIYSNCNNNTEFRVCCINLGIEPSVYNEFLANKEQEN